MPQKKKDKPQKINAQPVVEPDPHIWVKKRGLETTKNVEVPTRLIDQIVGQDGAVEVAKQAAKQKRHLLLIGDPGTGKSMLAKAMAEILPKEKLNDVIVSHNDKNPNTPRVHQVEGGKGRQIIADQEKKAQRFLRVWRVMEYVVASAVFGFGIWMWYFLGESVLIFLFSVLIAMLFLYAMGQKRPKSEHMVSKLLIEHPAEKGGQSAPYVDGTGSHAGALLGDVRHDPYQSGGLETPPHVRTEAGAIHRAHKGVLFIDEINVLRLPSQQALLTAIQDGEYSIGGQSQGSAGAMVRTSPIPSEFVLVAAGNLDAVRDPDEMMSGGMHPALRSRIRGYGYEVFVNDSMDDTDQNREKLLQFIAQEVVRDGKIPHFDGPAAAEVIRQAQRRSGERGKLTLRLRELGGLLRTAGDYARKSDQEVVTLEHVRYAISSASSLEQQITTKKIEKELRKMNVHKSGSQVGVANGAIVVGTGDVGEPAGIVVPVEAAVVPALHRHGGAIIIGSGLKGVPHAGVENVGALLKTLKGVDIANHDLHVDAQITQKDATAEGIGIAAAVASISALEMIPVKQEYVLIGSLAVTGEFRPVEFTLQRIEIASKMGIRNAIVPKSLEGSLVIDDYILEQINVIYCESLMESLEHVLDVGNRTKEGLFDRLDRIKTVHIDHNGTSSGKKSGRKRAVNTR